MQVLARIPPRALQVLLVALVASPALSLAQTAPRGFRTDKALTQYPLDHWTTDQGLAQNIVPALAQSADGYLWAATQEGLVRFDGLRFHTINQSTGGLAESHVSALAADGKGGIWVGTVGGHIAHYANGRATAFSDRSRLPSGQARALLVDRRGALWIGIGDGGVGHFYRGVLRFYRSSRGLEGSQVTAFHEDPHGDVWIGFRDGPAVRAHVDASGTPSFFPVPGLPAGHVTSFASTRDRLWIGLREGGIAEVVNGRVRRLYGLEDGLSTLSVLALAADASGTLWIGFDRAGLGRLVAGRVSVLTAADGLGHDVVRSLLIDREGSLWIGTSGGGLNRLRDASVTPYSVAEGLPNKGTMTVFEDHAGAVWVGTEGGVSRITGVRVERTFTTADGLPSDVVYAIAQTPDGSLWFGTAGGGLARYEKGRFRSYHLQDGLPDETVYGLYVDRAGTLWAATGAGLVSFRNGQFSRLGVAEGLSSDLVTVTLQNVRRELWVGTYDKGLNLVRQGRVVAKIGAEEGLRSTSILALHESANGDVWVGTNGGGLHRIRNGNVVAFGTAEGLPTDKIFAILESEGRLWLTSNRGLVAVRTQDLESVAARRLARVNPRVYGRLDGLRSSEFNGGVQPSGWHGQDGRLWFPTTDGVASIHPGQIWTNPNAPHVVIEQLAAGDYIVGTGSRATIPAGARRFEFRFVGLSLVGAERVKYRYRLDGVDERWIDAGTRREASYTNLDPGLYTFRVQAANSDGVWSEQDAALAFELRPFFYQTWWFALLMGLAAVGLIVLVYALRVRHLHRRQRELELEVAAQTVEIRAERDRAEAASLEAIAQRAAAEEAKAIVEVQAEQLREMDRIKTRFFNNLSHELRTPLTLNIGPLENAIVGAYGPVSDELKAQFSSMLRNARRLLRLINQLLDLAKLDAGKASLHPQEGDFVSFTEGIVLAFSSFAQHKGLALNFESTERQLQASFDPECVEKVVYNLLSNAVKFTPEGGQIQVHLQPTALTVDGVPEPAVEVRVRDTGTGIAPEELPFIFDRFHRAEGTHSTVQEGTGIGLALVKDLVELHGGTVEVTSELGRGTEFRVVFQTGFAPSAGDGQSAPASLYAGALLEAEIVDEEAPTPKDLEVPGQPVILVVDDSRDVRDFIVSSLRGQFSIRTAVDGQDALEQIQVQAPDLVLSDVMMPRLDGHGLCSAIKRDPRYADIPVVLLTAKASTEERVEGLEGGADDYISKPFNSRELHARVRNLLALKAQREALEEARDLKSKLIRVVAHDLKSPLSGVKTLIQIATEDGDGLKANDESMVVVNESIDRMLQLIGRVLEAEAFDSGQLSLHRTSIDLDALARSVAEAHEPLAEAKHQTITVNTSGGNAWISGDTTWLRTAIENVVSNAVKYSRLGGTVRVAVEQDDEWVRLRVEDEGPGIRPEEQERLFQSFARLSSRPTGGESSTGIGLSITKQVMDLHSGTITVENLDRGGTAFTLALPHLEHEAMMSAATA